MTKNEKTRQKALRRRAARQAKKPQATREVLPARSWGLTRDSGSWPLSECLISEDWQKSGELVQILVARESPAGSIAAGVFLVDLGCLGVKSAIAEQFHSPSEFDLLRRSLMSTQSLVRADLNTVAKVIREAVAYARQLGFSPDADFREASLVLGDADPDASEAVVPLGRNGKPFYVAGPHDNARRIVERLTKVVGPGNFDYVGFLEMPSQ